MSSGDPEGAPPREPIPIEGSYRLFDEAEIAEFIGSVGVVPFIHGLRDEIEAVYSEAGLAGAPRSNILGDRGGEFATEEVMTCSGPDYTVMKRIGSDPERAAEDRPTVYGDMHVIEAGTGQVRLLCGAVHLTALRTAATSALVLDRLKPELETLSVVGAGVQGRMHAFAITALSPNVKRILLRDMDLSKAQRSAEELQEAVAISLGDRAGEIDIEAVSENDRSIESESDAIVTATFGLPDDAPVLSPLTLRAGTVIAAVGADMEGKRELDRHIYQNAKFVSDEVRQSLHEGELQHAATEIGMFAGHIEHMRFADYHGRQAGGRLIGITELLADPDIFIGRRTEPLTVYDSTGFSGQDLAAVRLMLKLLKEKGYPQQPRFNAEPGFTLSEALGRKAISP